MLFDAAGKMVAHDIIKQHMVQEPKTIIGELKRHLNKKLPKEKARKFCKAIECLQSDGYLLNFSKL